MNANSATKVPLSAVVGFFFPSQTCFSPRAFSLTSVVFAKDNDLVLLSLKHGSHKTIIAPCSPIIRLMKRRPASVCVISSSTLYLWDVNRSSMEQQCDGSVLLYNVKN